MVFIINKYTAALNTNRGYLLRISSTERNKAISCDLLLILGMNAEAIFNDLFFNSASFPRERFDS